MTSSDLQGQTNFFKCDYPTLPPHIYVAYIRTYVIRLGARRSRIPTARATHPSRRLWHVRLC